MDIRKVHSTGKPSDNGMKSQRETMSLFEINESCDRLSKPETETGYTIKDHSTYDCKEAKPKPHHERFEGKKRMKTKEVKSLVDRLYVTDSSRSMLTEPLSKCIKTRYTKNSYSDLKDNVYKAMSGHS